MHFTQCGDWLLRSILVARSADGFGRVPNAFTVIGCSSTVQWRGTSGGRSVEAEEPCLMQVVKYAGPNWAISSAVSWDASVKF